MQIGHEVERLLVLLQLDVLPDRAEVVAPVNLASGLDAGKNAHGWRCA